MFFSNRERPYSLLQSLTGYNYPESAENDFLRKHTGFHVKTEITSEILFKGLSLYQNKYVSIAVYIKRIIRLNINHSMSHCIRMLQYMFYYCPIHVQS